MTDQTVHFLDDSNEMPQEGYILRTDGAPPTLIDGILSVGRATGCDIRVRDPYVSSKHCQFERRPNGFFVRDLKSRNGVKLNGVRVTEAELLPGAEITVGSTSFIFQGYNSNSNPQCPLTSKNKDWQEQLNRLPAISKTDMAIFLKGESGTGKEVLARTIHELSDRRRGPMISVNCSALTESLVESELFGHIKGSFTGATSDRKGAFEAARDGTLFLDEIGDLPLFLQPKLLRAIENSEIKPVGSDKAIPTNVRIISATHKNIERMIENELFRADLYFRIHVIKVAIPALRHRLEDFDDLLYDFCREYRVSFSVPTIDMLKTHMWPGNVRELKNTVARATALFPQTRILPSHLLELINIRLDLPQKTSVILANRDPRKGLPPLQEAEKEMIQARLLANGFNQRRTAAELGIPKSTLHDRIKSYQIETKKTKLY
jgi:transcriptional regulator with PAS, ATPase and Fis domain